MNIMEEGNIDLMNMNMSSPFHSNEQQSPMIRDINSDWEIVWRGVTKEVKIKLSYKKSSKKVTKTIVSNSCGQVSPGEVMAIAGTSGSGKTSLLHVLGGRSKAGEVYINGYKYCSDMRRKISFILQEDLFPSSTTYSVRDELIFFSAMKSRRMTGTERAAVIASLTQKLGIYHLLDIPIDILSGGERKRVQICSGMLGEAKILLIDEATSGLDSGAGTALIKSLRNLADDFKVTIILSIHSPNHQVYKLFDKLILMCEGKTVYNGYCLNFINYLSSMGYNEPHIKYSPLDFVLDLLYNEDHIKYELIEKWRGNEDLSLQVNSIIEASHNVNNVRRPLINYPANYMTQLVHLFIRSWKSSSTNSFSVLNISQTVAVALVIGSCWLQLNCQLESNVAAVSSYLYFIQSYWLFSGMFGGLLEFIPELQILTIERQAGVYRLSAYFLSKSLSCLPAKVTLPLIFSLVSYPMVIVPFQIKTFLLVTCCLILTTLVGDSVGLFIGTVTHNTNQAISLCVIISIAILILGGFYVKSLWIYLSWAKYASFLRYSYFASIKLQFMSFSKIYCDRGNLLLCKDRPYISSDLIVQWLGDSEEFPNNQVSSNSNSSTIIDISICLLFLFVFRLLSYLMLRFNHFKLRRE